MRRFLRHILLFLAVTLPLYVVLLWLLGDLGVVRTAVTRMGSAGHTFSRMRELEAYPGCDVLFIGSSHAYRTFDTRTYSAHGIKSFNLGSSNQTPAQSLALLTDYLDSLHPRCVVFEVHPDVFANDGVESTVDLLVNAPLTSTTARMALSTGSVKAFNTLLYAFYNQRLRHRADTFVEAGTIDGSVYVPGGYVEREDCHFVPAWVPPITIDIRPDQMKAMRQCLALFMERGIPCLLVQVQDAPQQMSAYTNLTEFQQAMASLAPFYYHELPLVDTLHFCDNEHLNVLGAELFNAHFLPVLQQFLTDNNITPHSP